MTPTASLAAFRFGTGLPLAEDAPATPEALLAALAGPDEMAQRWPIAGFATLDPLTRRLHQIPAKKKADAAMLASADALRAELDAIGAQALRHTIARSIEARDGLRERLVAFWADHFTISAGGNESAAMVYAFVEDAIRPHLSAPFAEMLTAATLHPAMLNYLDQSRSIGPNSREAKRRGGGLNENLARELLELHSLGVAGGYDQDDVRQMAELLTGLTYDRRKGFEFNPKLAEPGAETVLGKTYDGKGEAPIRAALADLARHPQTARHICGKLAVHFLSETPDQDVIAAMVTAWDSTGGDLSAVYAALLNHPASWAPEAAKARQPWEFILACLRALGVSGAEVTGWDRGRLTVMVLDPLRAMGQRWKSPLGPDGWKEEIGFWITPQGLAERIDWAMTKPDRLVRPLPHPADFARTALGDRASDAVIWAAERAENRAEGIGIVLASPEFNRR